jgi:glyoxylase-like metal-dependent hydrolase (beta-lactamase superfamily II)
MQIHHLSCGTMCPFGGRWLNGDRAPWQTGLLVCHVLLIETERSGLVLVDTGFGLLDVEKPSRLGTGFVLGVRPRLSKEKTAAAQVEALGFAREDVRHIVLTHMDLDHASGLPDFPRATVHVHADEHRAATVPSFREKLRYRSVQWAHEPRFETYTPDGERWHGFECVRSLRGLPPEVLMIPLAGHSRGHSGIAVETRSGWLLHAGDAYFHASQVTETPKCPPLLGAFQRNVAFDLPRMLENQARLRELACSREDVRVFSAHDPDELASLAQGLERRRAAAH